MFNVIFIHIYIYIYVYFDAVRAMRQFNFDNDFQTIISNIEGVEPPVINVSDP